MTDVYTICVHVEAEGASARLAEASVLNLLQAPGVDSLAVTSIKTVASRQEG